MAATNDTIVVYAGNKRTLRFTVVDEAGDAFDLTGYDVRWALSKYGQSGSYGTTAEVNKHSDNVDEITVASNVVDVVLVGADTAALAAGDYYHELEIVDAQDESLVVAVGDVELRNNVVNA